MKVTQLKLIGFRNFKNAVINISEKTLIIGANDVGKSNMLNAMRILLDRSYSDFDIEPKDCDFYCHEVINELIIQLKFEGIVEDCIISKFPGKISDNGELFLQYKAWKDSLDYKFYAGSSESLLEEIEGRFYRKVLHLRYIGSSRDLSWYMKREKRNLINDSKGDRDNEEIKADKEKLVSIEGELSSANSKIGELSYVRKATQAVNTELSELSFHHSGQEVVFDVGASDIAAFVDNLHLVSRVDTTSLAVGGDGRNNQIFLALWAARNLIREENPLEVSLYCIEEPEAHLHPHQQRKLAEYLVRKLNGQVFITSHSPHIACEFSPNSIVRLLSKRNATVAANSGCSKIIENAIYEFGYRLNVIAAEAFFSNTVLIVEGPSEVLFYKVLAREIGIDLDRFNISILMAAGVGFTVFVKVLDAFEIDWVLRTDNDIIKIPKKAEYRMAGVQRLIDVYSLHNKDQHLNSFIKQLNSLLSGFPTAIPPKPNFDAGNTITIELEKYNLFISGKDLENDILDEGLLEEVLKFCDVDNREDALQAMTGAKATFMFDFLKNHSASLKKLRTSNLSKPLLACKNLIEAK